MRPGGLLGKMLGGYAAVAIAAFLWGTTGVAARPILASGLTPLQAAVWRASGAFVLLFVCCLLVRRQALAITLPDLPLFAAYGLVSVAGFMTIYFTAIDLSTVATTAVLLHTAPAWVVVLAREWFQEPITRMKAAAVGLAFAGCVLVIGVLGPVVGAGTARLTPAGLLAGLGAGLTYALYSIFGKVALRRHAALTTVVYSLAFGAHFLLIANAGLPKPPPGSLVPLAYVTVFPTASAYLLYIGGLRLVEAGRAAPPSWPRSNRWWRHWAARSCCVNRSAYCSGSARCWSSVAWSWCRESR